jgi:DNA-binding response OmpR family regulator
MNSLLNSEALMMIRVGFLIIIAVGLLSSIYWFIFRRKTAGLLRNFPTEPSPLRGGGAPDLDPVLTPARLLQIDPASKEVRLRGGRVDLSPKEYELVSLLASEPGRVFSTREILGKIWSEGNSATDKDVKQYIYLLRKKLEIDPEHPQVIATVRGFGYKLLPEDQPSTH